MQLNGLKDPVNPQQMKQNQFNPEPFNNFNPMQMMTSMFPGAYIRVLYNPIHTILHIQPQTSTQINYY